VITSNSKHETLFNVSSINIAIDQAIADAGATGHFVIPGTPVTHITRTTNPLVINLPDGEKLVSTHICRLNVPWLPDEACDTHIVPGLAHTSLISMKILCDTGCKVIYDENTCSVYFNHKMMWIGQREPSTGLWVLPLDPTNAPEDPANHHPTDTATNHVANNAYTSMTSKDALIKYLH
jgi:hypothetical protein